MIALSLTCRPHWKPWLLHQFRKQHTGRLIVFDDCSKPQEWPGDVSVIRPGDRLRMSLGEKRDRLLELATEPFAWFDDDDWHPSHRLASHTEEVTGCRHGLFCDVRTLRTRRLEVGEPVIFNGATFDPKFARVRFQPLHRGEDTAWMREVCKEARVLSTPDLEHVWISHDGNVTGKRGSMTFEGPAFDRFDTWEKEFLRNV